MIVYIVQLPYSDDGPIAAFQSRENAEAFAAEHYRQAIEEAKRGDPNESFSKAWCVSKGETWEQACIMDKAFVEVLEVKP